MGNCISQLNVCTGNIDLKAINFNDSENEQIDVYLKKYEMENFGNILSFVIIDLIKKYLKENIRIHQIHRVVKIYEKNIISKITLIQRLIRKHNLKNNIFVKSKGFQKKNKVFNLDVNQKKINVLQNTFKNENKNERDCFSNNEDFDDNFLSNENRKLFEDDKLSPLRIGSINAINYEYKFIKSESNQPEENRSINIKSELRKVIKLNSTFLSENKKMFNRNLNDDKSYEIETYKEKAKIIFSNSSYYIGDIESDTANGFGIYINTNSDIFKGFWQNDKAEGIGSYKSESCTLMGYWRENKQCDFGINYVKKNKIYYEGEFNNGKKEGFGILLMNDGKYEGLFHNDKLQGIGSFYFKDGRIFYGEWYENKMEGFGLLIWKDGKKFEGVFKDNKKNGYGIFYSENKIYFGNWRNSKLEGIVIIHEKGTFNQYFYQEGKKIKKIRLENHKICCYLKELIEYE